MARRATAVVRRASSPHHPKPATQTDKPPPRPGRSTVKGSQWCPHPRTGPRPLPMSSTCLGTSAATGPTPSPRHTLYQRVCVSAYAFVPPTPCAPPRRTTTRTPPGQPLPPVPTTPPRTYTHAQTQGRRPAHGTWWQCWTHTQLPELLKWACAEPSLEGLVRRPPGSRRRTVSSSQGAMDVQDAWGAMLADAPHPQGVPSSQLCAPQDHPNVLSRLRKTRQATRREGKRASHITRSAPPHTNTISPPCKRPRTDTGSSDTAPTQSTPYSMTRLILRPVAPPPNPKEGAYWAKPGSRHGDTPCYRLHGANGESLPLHTSSTAIHQPHTPTDATQPGAHNPHI